MRRKAAFTLSEVLIALLIIGVIAAFTLPVLFNKIEEVGLNASAKKSYSLIINSLRLLHSDGEDLFSCYPNKTTVVGECSKLYTKLANKMKAVQTCPNNAYEKGCVPNYTYESSSGMPGFAANRIKNNARAYVFSNGMVIATYYDGGYYPYFLLDTNGKKGPNKRGCDLFPMRIDINTTEDIPKVYEISGHVHTTCKRAKTLSQRIKK